MDVLVSVAGLRTELAGDEPPTLLDIRWTLAGADRPGYLAGHLPGARFVDLDRELAGPPGAAGRHPLPSVRVFEPAMRRAGVSRDSDVVTYDEHDGWGAARAWWCLRYFGHERVRVLDGGYAAWVEAGGPMSVEEPPAGSGDLVARPGGMPLLDAAGAGELARTGVLLDARAGERYRGEVEPIDPVGGHIPGAVSAPTVDNVGSAGRLLDAAALAARFAGLGATGPRPVGCYCGSGVSAAHQVLALERAGVRAALYPGSWSEWTVDSSRPVATGSAPG